MSGEELASPSKNYREMKQKKKIDNMARST